MKFVKRPIVVEAIQYDGTSECADQMVALYENKARVDGDGDTYWTGKLLIDTLEGTMTASPGDWIITGIAGEIYPCKPEIFAATYEPLEEKISEFSCLAMLGLDLK